MTTNSPPPPPTHIFDTQRLKSDTTSSSNTILPSVLTNYSHFFTQSSPPTLMLAQRSWLPVLGVYLAESSLFASQVFHTARFPDLSLNIVSGLPAGHPSPFQHAHNASHPWRVSFPPVACLPHRSTIFTSQASYQPSKPLALPEYAQCVLSFVPPAASITTSILFPHSPSTLVSPRPCPSVSQRHSIVITTLPELAQCVLFPALAELLQWPYWRHVYRTGPQSSPLTFRIGLHGV
ncbi:hypothetical protein HYDPIDRAFT_34178 [Hydnomerulius pinastri MD-312]|uniref:Uncharacterized protein n=1 Tax=Hydnomerulius pinastri MD-312 TaxID=994086 RepID=A0A0C9W6M9_9AGAM|nr:hypothetical protein HYDPIDRAFT_34178 [Hydnomerulius pinastri MD-312]